MVGEEGGGSVHHGFVGISSQTVERNVKGDCTAYLNDPFKQIYVATPCVFRLWTNLISHDC